MIYRKIIAVDIEGLIKNASAVILENKYSNWISTMPVGEISEAVRKEAPIILSSSYPESRISGLLKGAYGDFQKVVAVMNGMFRDYAQHDKDFDMSLIFDLAIKTVQKNTQLIAAIFKGSILDSYHDDSSLTARKMRAFLSCLSSLSTHEMSLVYKSIRESEFIKFSREETFKLFFEGILHFDTLNPDSDLRHFIFTKRTWLVGLVMGAVRSSKDIEYLNFNITHMFALCRLAEEFPVEDWKWIEHELKSVGIHGAVLGTKDEETNLINLEYLKEIVRLAWLFCDTDDERVLSMKSAMNAACLMSWQAKEEIMKVAIQNEKEIRNYTSITRGLISGLGSTGKWINAMVDAILCLADNPEKRVAIIRGIILGVQDIMQEEMGESKSNRNLFSQMEDMVSNMLKPIFNSADNNTITDLVNSLAIKEPITEVIVVCLRSNKKMFNRLSPEAEVKLSDLLKQYTTPQ